MKTSAIRTIDPQEIFVRSGRTARNSFLLRYAILAPSSHNTQPWLFRADEAGIDVTANRERFLSASDRSGREAHISIGCAIENIVLAAGAYGLSVSLEHPGGVAARIAISGDPKDLSPANRAILEAIVSRQNNRLPYLDKPIPREFVAEINSFVPPGARLFFVDDAARKNQLREASTRALGDAFRDKGFTDELSRWVRPSLPHYEDGLVGYNLDIPFPISFVLPFMIKNLDGSAMQMKMHETLLRSSPAFVVIATERDDAGAWLDAGMFYERIAVAAQTRGITTAVFAASIEIGSHYESVKRILQTPLRPQVFFRIGYPPRNQPFAPRIPLEKLLRN